MSTDAGTSSASGSIFLRKTGPLANWMWMALLLLIALVFSMWRRNQAAAVAVDDEQTVTEPGDQTPPPVFILPQNPQPTVPINITLPGAPPPPATRPPVWGGINPPGRPPIRGPIVTPTPAPPIGTRPPEPPKPPPKPAPPPKPPAIKYDAVKVVKYVDPPGKAGPAWNSTFWGIAKQYGWGSAENNWHTLWNDPRNAELRKKRGTYKNLQPGDVVYARRK